MKNATRENWAQKFLLGAAFPLFLLLLMVLTWALQTPHYGFYLDDWIYLSAYDQGGFHGLMDYAVNDGRPGLMPWVIALGFKIAGKSPLHWQIYSLFWRYLGGVACWALLRTLWKSKKEIASFSAILFMLFPFFKHQAFSIAYNQNWIQYALLLGSFWLTVLAVQADQRGKRVLLLMLSLLLSGVQLFMTEYFLTLELARVPLIWVALKHQGIEGKQRTRKTLHWYLPFGVLLGIFLILRFAVMPSLIHDRNEISWFREFPSVLALLLHVLQMFIQYCSESVFGVWYRSLDPAGIDLSILSIRAALGVAVLAVALLIFSFIRLKKDEDTFQGNAETREIFLIGVVAVLLGFLPGMAIDRSPSTSFIYHDRFLIPSFWGISVALVSGIVRFLKGRTGKIVLLSFFCGICVFFQIKNSIYYRSAWENMQNFQWQLQWRVPDIEENTALLGDGIIASFMGGWADGAMVLEMYGKQTGYAPAPYWYLVVGEGDFKPELEQKLLIGYTNKIYQFEAKSGDFLVLTKPEWDRCLWLLDEDDLSNPYIAQHTRNLIAFQNKSRIRYDSTYQMPAEIFGADYRHDWCYYYELAAKAVDRKSYDEALALYDQSKAAGLKLKKPVEMTPFIRAAALSGDWALAAEMTREAGTEPHITWEYFKNLWDALERQTTDSPERTAARTAIADLLTPPQ